MKLKVIRKFYDVEAKVTREQGKVFDVSETRGKKLLQRRLVEKTEEKKAAE